MEPQLLRKNAATGKRGPSSNEFQPLNRESKRDDMQLNNGLLVTTARRIGSVLGKIVARTEASLSPRRPTMELTPKKTPRTNRTRKASARRRSSETGSEGSQLKPANKSHGKDTHSVRRSPSRNVKRKRSPASRNARSDQE